MYNIELIVTTFFQENIWIIINDKNEAIIIDPGFLPIENFDNFFTSKQIKPIAIVNTHAHPDHIYSVVELQDKYKIPFYLFEKEKSNLGNLLSLSLAIGANDIKVPENITFFNDVILKIGNFEFEVVHTPGHTEGGICLKFDKHLICGDTLFQGSIGRIDLPGGSITEMKKSIEQFKQMNDNIIIYPGHGGKSTIGEEKKNNPYF